MQAFMLKDADEFYNVICCRYRFAYWNDRVYLARLSDLSLSQLEAKVDAIYSGFVDGFWFLKDEEYSGTQSISKIFMAVEEGTYNTVYLWNPAIKDFEVKHLKRV